MPMVAHRHDGPVWYRRLSGVLGMATLVGVVAAGFTTRNESRYKGLAQRAFLAVVFAWHTATMIATTMKARGSPAPPSHVQ
jgi:hypothetical protein